MVKPTDFIQCELVKSTSFGESRIVTWIDKKFAKFSVMLKIYDEDSDSWDDGWQVKAVYGTSMPNLPNIRKLVKAHRHNTGDDLKRNR